MTAAWIFGPFSQNRTPELTMRLSWIDPARSHQFFTLYHSDFRLLIG